MIKSEDVLLPTGVLRQTYEENTVDDGKQTEAEYSPQCSHPITEDSMYFDDEPSTSFGTVSDDFDLIHSVKEDLKQNIHKRRRQKGLGDIDIDSDLPRTYEVGL